MNSIHLYIFADNNHMYLIMDDVMRTSLVETVKEKKTLLFLIVYILPFLYLFIICHIFNLIIIIKFFSSRFYYLYISKVFFNMNYDVIIMISK